MTKVENSEEESGDMKADLEAVKIGSESSFGTLDDLKTSSSESDYD